MSEPKNHHYIPQSYLRNFAEEKKGEHYVYVRNAGEKFHPTNVKNICSETYFYSIPDADDDKRNIVEKYYAENIDNNFSEITKIVTDDKITEIDRKTRVKIITSALSLYFRTPKFLNFYKDHLLKVSELARKYTLESTEVHTIEFLGKKFDLRNVDYVGLENNLIKQNKIFFLQEHFEIFNLFTDFKLEDGISVKKIIDDSEFITSDNPVIIRNSGNAPFNLFDPENIIHLPINHKYLLSILPKSEKEFRGKLMRIEGRLRSVLVINSDVEKNSERWIIGSKNSIDNHIYDQFKYNQPTPENEKWVSDSEKQAEMLGDLIKILERTNGNITDEFIVALKILNKNELFKDDPNLSRNIEDLRLKGYEI